jgi:hypothetical protein
VIDAGVLTESPRPGDPILVDDGHLNRRRVPTCDNHGNFRVELGNEWGGIVRGGDSAGTTDRNEDARQDNVYPTFTNLSKASDEHSGSFIG